MASYRSEVFACKPAVCEHKGLLGLVIGGLRGKYFILAPTPRITLRTTYHVSSSGDRRVSQASTSPCETRHLAISDRPHRKRFAPELFLVAPFERESHTLVSDLRRRSQRHVSKSKGTRRRVMIAPSYKYNQSHRHRSTRGSRVQVERRCNPAQGNPSGRYFGGTLD